MSWERGQRRRGKKKRRRLLAEIKRIKSEKKKDKNGWIDGRMDGRMSEGGWLRTDGILSHNLIFKWIINNSVLR